MTTQACATLPLICDLFSLPLVTSEDSIKFSPQDCGYEVDEDELVSGMLVQLPDCLTGRSIPEVDPEEFEAVYGCFLS